MQLGTKVAYVDGMVSRRTIQLVTSLNRITLLLLLEQPYTFFYLENE